MKRLLYVEEYVLYICPVYPSFFNCYLQLYFKLCTLSILSVFSCDFSLVQTSFVIYSFILIPFFYKNCFRPSMLFLNLSFRPVSICYIVFRTHPDISVFADLYILHVFYCRLHSSVILFRPQRKMLFKGFILHLASDVVCLTNVT